MLPNLWKPPLQSFMERVLPLVKSFTLQLRLFPGAVFLCDFSPHRLVSPLVHKLS